MTSSASTKQCPVCTEYQEMDLLVSPCPCALQICIWCFEKAQKADGRCGRCRKPYGGLLLEEDEESSFDGMSSGSSPPPPPPPRRGAPLRDIRVVRRDLCYVVGLSLDIVSEENTLKGFSFFGKYGKVLNVIVNRNPNFKSPDKKRSCAVYVTFSKRDEARLAILDINDTIYQGRKLRASYGTTKYCSNFLKNQRCQNKQCFYLHERGADVDSFTIDELRQIKEKTGRTLTCSALLAAELDTAIPPAGKKSSLFGYDLDQVLDYYVHNYSIDQLKNQAHKFVLPSTLGPLRQKLSHVKVSMTNLPPPPEEHNTTRTIVHPTLQKNWAAASLMMYVDDPLMLSPATAASSTIWVHDARSVLPQEAPSRLINKHYVTPADQIARSPPPGDRPPGFAAT